VLAAGGSAGKILFSGVGKTETEIALALQKGVGCINLESEGELERVAAVAAGSAAARRWPSASIRTSMPAHILTFPPACAKTSSAWRTVTPSALPARRRPAAVEVVGIGCHVGSMLTEAAPFVAAAERLVALVDRLEAAGIRLQHIDVGGGIGIRYRDETPQPIGAFVAGVRTVLGARRTGWYSIRAARSSATPACC